MFYITQLNHSLMLSNQNWINQILFISVDDNQLTRHDSDNVASIQIITVALLTKITENIQSMNVEMVIDAGGYIDEMLKGIKITN